MSIEVRLKSEKSLYICGTDTERYAGACIPPDGGGEEIWTKDSDYD